MKTTQGMAGMFGFSRCAMRLGLTGACLALGVTHPVQAEYRPIMAITSPEAHQIGNGITYDLETELDTKKFPIKPGQSGNLLYFISIATPGQAQIGAYSLSPNKYENWLRAETQASPTTNWLDTPSAEYVYTPTNAFGVLLTGVTYVEGAQDGSNNWLNYRYRAADSDPWQYVWAQMEFHESDIFPSDQKARRVVSYIFSYDQNFTVSTALAIRDADIKQYWTGSHYTHWDNPGSWTALPGLTPGALSSTTNVLIAGDRTADISTTDATVGSLYLGGLGSGSGTLEVANRTLNAANLFLGYNSPTDPHPSDSGKLLLSQGGKVILGGSILMGGTNDEITVKGHGTSLSVGNSITMQGSGAITVMGGSLSVGDSITMTQREANTITVTDGGHLSVENLITLEGSENKFLVTGGATATLGSISLPYQLYSVNNTFMVSGSASATANAIFVSDTNSLRVTDGGHLAVESEILLGGRKFSGPPHAQTLLVDGAGSALIQNATADLVIGFEVGAVEQSNEAGFIGASVTNGGLLQSGNTFLGNDRLNNGMAIVSGTGSRWEARSLHVGEVGAGEVRVEDGGSLTVSSSEGAILGVETGSEGILSVTNGSFNGGLIVGDKGQGVAQFTSAQWNADGKTVVVGKESFMNNRLTFDQGSEARAGHFSIGKNGRGTLNILGGSAISATSTSGSTTFGEAHGAKGSAVIAGARSSFHTNHEIILGDLGEGSMTLQGGAHLIAGGGMILGNDIYFDGYQSLYRSSGSLFLDGGLAEIQGPLTVGGTGVGNISIEGASEFNVTGPVILGKDGTAEGKITLSGSSLHATASGSGSNFIIGKDGRGQLTLQNGADLHASSLTLAEGATGTGILNVGSDDYRNPLSAGNINLNVNSINFGEGHSELNFNLADRIIVHSALSSFANTQATINLHGPGTAALRGYSASFHGKTTVGNYSTLLVDGHLGGQISVQAYGTLGGSGVVETVSLNPTSTLRPGGTFSQVGTLTISRAEMYGTSTVNFHIETEGLNGRYSQLSVGSWINPGAYDPRLLVDLNFAESYKAKAGDSFYLFSGTPWSFSPNDLQLVANKNLLPLGLYYDTRYLASGGTLYIEAHAAGTIINDVEINGDMDTIFGNLLVEDLTFNTDGDDAQLLINGSVAVETGDVTVDQGTATISGGDLIIVDDMNKNGDGTLNTTDTVIVAGDLNVNAGAYLVNGTTMVGDTTFVDAGATLGGSGVLDSPNVTMAGTLSPGNSPGTLTINGNYTQTGSGTFLLEIASPSNLDQLIVNGTANLAGTLDVQSWGGYQFAYGQQFDFIQADEITGEFDTILMPNANVLRGRFVTDGGTGRLLVAPTSYTLVAQNQNQHNVAAALDSFIPATSGDRVLVSTALDLQSAGEYGNAFEQIAPGFYQSLTDTVIEQTNAQNQMLAQRLSGVRLGQRGFHVIGLDQAPLTNDRDGKNVMDAKNGKDIITQGAATDWSVFVMGNGIFSRVRSASQVPNYNFNSGGFTVGVDYTFGGDKTATMGDGKKAVGSTEVGSTLTMGLYTGYQGTYAKYDNGGRMTINSALFGGYASYGNGGFYSNLIVGGAYNGYSASRSIDFSTIDRTARSAPNGGSLTTYLDAGYDITVGKFTFGPILSGQYTYAGTAGFTESGADSLDLKVGQQNANSLRTNVGGRIAYTWQASDSITLIPEGRMFWQHEFLNGPRSLDASLDGGSGPGFGYTTTAPGRDSVFAGAGVTALIGDQWSTSFYYNADFGRQDYVSHMISATLGWKF